MSIQIECASKSYGKQMVLQDISAEFKRGMISGIIGRNGSGKTVLLKCICSLTPLDSGRIAIFGKELGRDIFRPESLGAIINEPGFLPSYSGYRNLSMIASIKRQIRKEQIKETMRLVGLDPESRKWVCKYSMGMKQRLGIAQAIMENPDLLILDEPMNGLDNRGVDDMRKLFLELKGQGKTILLASHNREDIEILCDHVYEMDAGRLTQMR
ncbi:MAG: ATP-binding cassette domain-containing protein [Clostridia bacterium]|nr:ATP-binding cassette domain-containing protein [Clostridia bacterium]